MLNKLQEITADLNRYITFDEAGVIRRELAAMTEQLMFSMTILEYEFLRKFRFEFSCGENQRRIVPHVFVDEKEVDLTYDVVDKIFGPIDNFPLAIRRALSVLFIDTLNLCHGLFYAPIGELKVKITANDHHVWFMPDIIQKTNFSF